MLNQHYHYLPIPFGKIIKNLLWILVCPILLANNRIHQLFKTHEVNGGSWQLMIIHHEQGDRWTNYR